MSTVDSIQQRMVRRAQHRSRSITSVIVAVALFVLFVWLAVETILSGVNARALLISPADLLSWLTNLPEKTVPAGLIAAGAGIALIGMIVLILALSSGRKPKHQTQIERAASLVDDGVLASALAQQSRTAAKIQPDQVLAYVSAHSAEINARPTSGVAIDRSKVDTAVDEEVASWGLKGRFTPRVKIQNQGVIGA